jgi:hypothetical protein
MKRTAAFAAKQAQLWLACKAEGVNTIADMSLSVSNAHHDHQVITSFTLEQIDLSLKAKPNLTLGLACLN